VRDLCRAHGILYQGFSLLTANQPALASPEVRSIAKRLGAGVARVIFRFSMQIGMLPLTGTTNSQHMKDDLRAHELKLSPEELSLIESIAI